MRLLLGIVCGLISFIQAQKPGADEESSATGWAGHSLRFHLAGSARFVADVTAPSPSTLRLWARGDGEHAALFVPAERSPLTLSFLNLVETFVLASIRRVHGISMQRVRKALRYVGRELGVKRPLIHARFRTNGVRLFVDHAGELLDVTSPEQALLREVLDASLERIECGPHVAERLYPWVRLI